jgi:hypothetical protein
MKQSKMQYFYEVIETCVEGLLSVKSHAVYEHEYKTDEQLKTRCAIEKTAGASCFNEGVDVVEKIVDIIYDSTVIIPWLDSETNDDLLIVTEEKGCGRKFLRSGNHVWADGALVCDKIILILGKRRDMAGGVTGMYVKTCYPE